MISGRTLTILGIETSCDETAAAVVRRNADRSGTVLADIVHAQTADHAAYGGVVPEIAARAHVAIVDRIVAQALEQAQVDFTALDAVAATAGPGLIGGVMVGLVTAKAIAFAHNLPLVAVNHLEAHALTARLTHNLRFPFLLLLVSGGHTQLLAVEGVGRYRRLGTTLDDALGEAFDKTAKLLGLGYPGGPEVERWAAGGDPNRFDLPRPMLGTAHADFSFSGLKTAIRRAAEHAAPLDDQAVGDLCAAFQQAAAEAVADRVERAIGLYRTALGANASPTLVMAGGVASNRMLAGHIEALANTHGFTLIVPPARLCTDNGAMVAWAGAERAADGLFDDFAVPARARWPLDDQAPAAIGAGVKA